MALELDADITGLRGAEYNPRHIGQEDLDTLARSIRELGLVKPLIVRGDLLVAGHQRTKALRHLGITRAALFRLSAETTVYDEIRFNQLHNGTDLDAGDEQAMILGGFETAGWHVVDTKKLTANMRGRLASVRQEICELIQRFGPWGGVVALKSGRIIHAAQYAIAAKLTGTPLTVHVIDQDKEAIATELLSRTYGVFSYEKLERQTYIQTLAQMNRLRDSASGKGNKSTLYETMVIPFLSRNPRARCLDFGAGHGDYASALRRRGFLIHDVELFRRTGSSMVLDDRAITRMIDQLCQDLRFRGRYDAVICDSVLNSVDCVDAENAVMTVIASLAKPGGAVFFSGRPWEVNDRIENFTKRSALQHRRGVEFLDKDGFTALFRQGRWFYQKYHRKDQVPGLASRFGLQVEKHVHGGNSWQVQSKKLLDLPAHSVKWACDYEFNLPLGDNRTLNRHDDVNHALDNALKAEAALHGQATISDHE